MRIVDISSCSHLTEVRATGRDGLPRVAPFAAALYMRAPEWACSSVVEHCVDIAGVASSILATPTIIPPENQLFNGMNSGCPAMFDWFTICPAHAFHRLCGKRISEPDGAQERTIAPYPQPVEIIRLA